MKYIVEVTGELPTYGALRNAVPLVTCGECRYSWHDLRKDPKDLPTHNRQYLCAFKNDTVCKYIVLTMSTMLDMIELIERWKEIDEQ